VKKLPFTFCLLGLYLFAFGQLVANAQALNEWTAYTSFGDATDLSMTTSHAWVTTAGGLYSVERSTGTISRFTVIDGLAEVGASAVAADEARNLIWIGYADGLLDRLDAQSGEIRTFRDIERADQFSSRGISKILVHQGSLFIATSFGIVVFDPVKNEVRDSYTRLGALPAAISVNDILIESDVLGQETIWVATDDGIARAPLDGSNLQDPASWIVETVGSTFSSVEVYSLAQLSGELYAGTQVDAYRRSASGQYQSLGLTNREVRQMSFDADQILASAEFTVLVIRAAGSSSTHSLTGMPFPVATRLDEAGRMWVIDADVGLGMGPIPSSGEVTASLDVIYLPSGPADGVFSDISISDDGSVWVSGVNAANTGFYKLATTGEWTSYSTLTEPELAGKAAFVHIFAGADGVGWAGSEGAGIVQVDVDGGLTLYDRFNSSLEPLVGSENFVTVGGLHEDNLGNLWVTTRASGKPLHVRSSSGEWTGFDPKIGQGLLSNATAYGRLFVDSFDEKWIVVQNELNLQRVKGLMVLDTGIPENPSDDEFRYFNSVGGAGQGLPSITVNVVAEDRDGLIWVGTDSGPAFFINTGIVARDPSAIAIWPQWADRSRGTFMLFGLNIRDIAVDPAGRIWFATDDGAWLVESVEGGYQVVHHFTTADSPIFSDDVFAVAVDEKTGEVYFSTDRGMVSFASDAIAPQGEAGELIVFPNPVRILDGVSPSIFIEGLVPSTSIRIVTATGNLVRRLDARGGRTRWDGRDEYGNLVSSGVYLIIAVGQNDEGTGYGKVAVIR